MWEGNVRTRQWIYDLESNELQEMELKNRPAAQMPVAALLPGEKRMVLGPIIDREERVMVTNLSMGGLGFEGAASFATGQPVEQGWFVGSGFAAGDKVTVQGAELLLSEEFRARFLSGEE